MFLKYRKKVLHMHLTSCLARTIGRSDEKKQHKFTYVTTLITWLIDWHQAQDSFHFRNILFRDRPSSNRRRTADRPIEWSIAKSHPRPIDRSASVGRCSAKHSRAVSFVASKGRPTRPTGDRSTSVSPTD
eukprot:Selendium_serpulae@DN6231_c2_g1_i6.p1